MPMYEFRCRECGEDYEELVSGSTADDDVECPTCGAEGAAERKLSAFAVSGGGSGGGSWSSAASSASCGGSSGFS